MARLVLVTRPQPGAADTAERLRASGWTPLLAPMLGITPRAATFPPREAAQALLVTSANALAGIPALWRSCPVFAVGAATAARARALGFNQVTSADGDATALAALAATRLDRAGGALLVAHGQNQGDTLCAALQGGGFRVWRAVTYEAVPAARLSAPAREAWRRGEIGAALVFSAETGRALVAAVARDGLAAEAGKITACAISAHAAAAICPLPWATLRVALRPDQESLLALLT